MSKAVLECIGVGRSYSDDALNIQVLSHLDFEVAEAESVNIIGSSGSGKSTLLHPLSGLDMPSEGKVILMNQDLGGLSQKQLGGLRNHYLGFVYQFHHLLPEFSALGNAMMPFLVGEMPKAVAEEKAVKVLKKINLDKRILRHPNELSGGERQRTAIVRVLVDEPRCLLVGEPTRNLDRKNAQNVLDMMLDLRCKLNTSLVVMTHDDELTERFDRVMTMKDGSLQVLQ